MVILRDDDKGVFFSGIQRWRSDEELPRKRHYLFALRFRSASNSGGGEDKGSDVQCRQEDLLEPKERRTAAAGEVEPRVCQRRPGGE
jgi:hypothetical protein